MFDQIVVVSTTEILLVRYSNRVVSKTLGYLVIGTLIFFKKIIDYM